MGCKIHYFLNFLKITKEHYRIYLPYKVRSSQLSAGPAGPAQALYLILTVHSKSYLKKKPTGAGQDVNSK